MVDNAININDLCIYQKQSRTSHEYSCDLEINHNSIFLNCLFLICILYLVNGKQ